MPVTEPIKYLDLAEFVRQREAERVEEAVRRVQDEARRHAEARGHLFGGSRTQPPGSSSLLAATEEE